MLPISAALGARLKMRTSSMSPVEPRLAGAAVRGDVELLIVELPQRSAFEVAFSIYRPGSACGMALKYS